MNSLLTEAQETALIRDAELEQMIKISQDKLKRLADELRAEAAAGILERAEAFALAIREAELERDREQLLRDKAAQLALLEVIR